MDNEINYLKARIKECNNDINYCKRGLETITQSGEREHYQQFMWIRNQDLELLKNILSFIQTNTNQK